MKCLYCHEVIDPLGKFCPKCGLPLSEEITVQSAGLPGASGSGQWLSGSKPLIALVLASAVGAFIGVSVGWMGARMGAQTESQPQVQVSVSQPAGTSETPRVAAAAAVPAPPAVTDSQPAAPDPSSSEPAPTPTSSDATASAEPTPSVSDQPVKAALLSSHEYDGVWASTKPKQRVKKYTYVPPKDPVPPPTPLVMNPFKKHDPQYVMMYWLGPTADLYGNNGPGPAEKESQGSQYFLEQY